MLSSMFQIIIALDPLMLRMLHCSSGAGVTIGFVNTTYSVNEGDSRVAVGVGVLSGVLSEDVVVVLTTRDDSATGTF